MKIIADILNSMLPELFMLITIFVLAFISMFYNVKFNKASKWIALSGTIIALFSLNKLQIEPIYYAFSDNCISDIF